MSPCPSRLELSFWEAEVGLARRAELTLHVGSCERCSAIIGDIAEARALLLGSDPPEASARAARVIVEAARQRRAPRRWLRFLAPVLLVPAAAALLLLVRPGSSHNAGIKGRLIVETYCNRGGEVFAAADGADFLNGDRLRFAYTQDRAGFLLVFGVDDAGRIFPYYEPNALLGVPVQAGARVFLPDAVELDSHRGWERIYFIWSETPVVDVAVRSAVASSLAKANGDVRLTSALDLPVEQVSLLLRRP
jgi:hypothetical protein